MKSVLIALALLAGDPARVSIHVYPSVVMAGGNIRVTCRVPVNHANRGLVVGIDPYTSSFHQLDEYAHLSYTDEFSKIPCDAFRAVCALLSNDRGTTQVQQPITVVGDCP